MKVCFVNLASGYSGGENQTFFLADQLLKNKIEVIAVTNPKSLLTRKLESIGIKTVCSNHPLRGHLSPLLRNVGVVHAHDGRAVHWASIHKTLFKTPFIVTRRIDNLIRENSFTHWSYAQADQLVGISSKICTVLSNFVSHKSKIELIPSSPISYDLKQEIIDREKNKYLGRFIVVQAASLLEHKGFDTSIKAAKLLKDQNIIFLFLGEGPYRNHLMKLAEGLSNVLFLGKQNDMGNWFRIADCIILPSKNEGLGSVLLESMLAGTPVIASNTGGIPDIVKDRKTGLLISPNDEKQLASAIQELSKNNQLKSELVNNAKEFIKPFYIENTSKRYLHIYKRILDTSSYDV